MKATVTVQFEGAGLSFGGSRDIPIPQAILEASTDGRGRTRGETPQQDALQQWGFTIADAIFQAVEGVAVEVEQR